MRRERLGAQPPRSCQDPDDDTPGSGGRWYFPRETSGGRSAWWSYDYPATVGRFRDQARKAVASEILVKMERAARGGLILDQVLPDGTAVQGEAGYLRGGSELMEIRIDRRLGENDNGEVRRLYTRLYYHEPAEVADALYFLHLAAKQDFPAGKPEQDQQIDRALARLDTCAFEAL